MKEKELLFSVTKKDFKIEFTKGSGNGGQNRNKRDTAVRITHIESGAVGYSEEEREQLQNKKKAFKRLCESEKFKSWLKIKTNQVIGISKTKEQIAKEIDTMIECDLKNGNIIIEEI